MTDKIPALQYEEVLPDLSLVHFINKYWNFVNASSAEIHYTVLPDGYFDLIVIISNEHVASVELFGLYTREIDVVVPGNSSVIGVSFLPLAAEYIFARNIAGLLNSFAQLSPAFLGLEYFASSGIVKWSDVLSAKMHDLLQKNGDPDPRKILLFNSLFQSKGTLTVGELARKSFWSARQINRYFKTYFGLPLKTYAGIIRCAHAYADISKGNLFPENSYYDQSHFIKEIRKHTSFKPKELYRNKNGRFLQFLLLSRK